MGRIADNRSKVTLARPNTASVRSTIPEHVARQLGLGAGDTLVWELDKDADGWLVTVRKAAGG